MAKSNQSNSQEIVVTIDDFRTLARKTRGELLPSQVGFEGQNIRFTEEYGSIEKRKSRSLYANMSTLGTSRIIFIDRFYRSAVEIYTKLLLHCDGIEGSSTITDETGKTIINTGVILDLMEYATNGDAQTAYVSNAVISATGGTITTVGTDKVHTFTADGTFTVTGSGTLKALVVAGGGQGGSYFGGGGGAGGYQYDAAFAVTAQAYSITIGAGGTGASAGQRGVNGQNSIFATITAVGGGGGGGNSAATGADGGCGGGGIQNSAGGSGSQGYGGGTGGTSSGGGGGGTGVIGSNGSSSTGGTGGNGTVNTIRDDSSIYYGGGGGGNSDSATQSAGGSGGGGAGGDNSGSPTAGSANTGGGGGGGNGSVAGANGGSGIAIMRYSTLPNLQCYSESVIVKQGTYSLKCIADTTTLNKTLTRTIVSPINLTGINLIRFNIYSTRTGSNIKISIHDSGGTTTEITPNITSANAWQTIDWDISAVADADKNAIDKITITMVDATSINTFFIDNIVGGQVVIDTSVKKFGTGSIVFVKGSQISIADNNDWYFGTGDFTIDVWVYFSSLTDAQVFCGQYEDANNYWYIKKDTNANGNKLSMEFKDGTVKGSYVMTSAWSGVAISNWYHLEFSRNSAVGLIFINGISQTLTETTAFGTNDVGNIVGTLVIGAQNLTNFFQGNMDEVRLSKGIVRNTVNFTIPISSYGNSANTKYLFSIYEDTLKVGNDINGSFSTLKSGFNSNLRWNSLTYKSHWYGCNGSDNNIVCDGLNVEDMGVPIPTAPTVALGSATGLTGTYKYKVTYEIDSYQEGSSSIASDPLTPSNEKITVTIPVSTNTRVSARNIYRTLAGGSIYYFLTRVADNTTTTYSDSIADGSLDTTIPAPIDNDSPPVFKYMSLHKSRIFGARLVDNLSRVVYSDVKNGMSLPDVFPVDNFFDVIKDNGEDTTAVLEDQYGQLIVMKPSAVVKIDTSTDDPVGWSGFDNVLSMNGCIAPYTAVKTPIGIIYLTRYAEGKKCLMLWNGSSTQPVFTELEPILSAISESRISDMIAKYHNGSYNISYTDPTDGNSYNDRVISIDLTSSSWVIDKKNVDCFSSWTSGMVGLSGADNGELYTSSSDTTGLIHHEDTLDAPLSESTIEMFYLSQWIDFGWLNPLLKRVRKQIFQVRVDFKRDTASGNIYFGYYINNSSTLVQKAFNLVTYASKGFFIYQFPIGTYFKNMRFRIYHADDIYALKIKAIHFLLSPEPVSELF